MIRGLLLVSMAAGAVTLYAGPDAPALGVVANPAPAAISSLTQLALRIGKDDKLPPNLVSVLGLGTHVTGLPVRQLVLRDGQEVRVFNVCVANHSDLVIFRHDEAAHASTVYLLSPKGRLRKAVSYIDGGESRALPAAEAQTHFAAEIGYWSAVSQRSSAQH